MKIRKAFETNMRGRRNLCTLGLGACICGCLAIVPGQTAAEEDFDYSSWIDVSVGGVIVDGHKPRFQQRHQLPAGAFGGVEAFHWEQMVGERGFFQIDGRGIFDNHDYLLRMELADPDRGYVRAGYRQFRTWYDGSGGFFPQNGVWFSVFDDDPLAIDRGEAWLEAGLTLPDWPKLTFRYTHQYRRGDKDSTLWGRVGTPVTGVAGERAFAPSFREIDERRHIFEGRAGHTLGATDFGAGLRYELSDQDNALNIHQNPGQANDRRIRQEEGVVIDIFSVHAYSKSQLHEKVLLTTGYAFTTLDTDLGGRRFYDPPERRAGGDVGFENLAGGSQVRKHVGTLNLMLRPWNHFAIVPSLRVQKEDLEGNSLFDRTAGPGVPGAFVPDQFIRNERDMLTVSQRLEARYTGFRQWVLYARGDWEQGQGDLLERSEAPRAGFRPVDRLTDFERFTQQYTVGANWYPHHVFNVALQYYRKMRDNDYEHLVEDRPGRHSAFIEAQDFTTDDFNIRLTLRPLNGLTLVSRYDFQLSTIDLQGTGLSMIQSGKTTSHIFSQAATWSPLTRLYVQAAANYAIDRTTTPADDIVGTAPAAYRVLEARNDYLTTSLNIGYALTEKTDIQTQYLYYLADNYEDNSEFSQPYGAGAREHAVSAGIVHRLRQNLVWSLKYGFFRYRDETSGWNTNYDAHLIYSSLGYRF
jgi:hypothetical protein